MPDYGLEGGWVRIDVAGSGDFNNLNSKIPNAQLTPAGQALLTQFEQRAAHSFTAEQEAKYSKKKLKTNQVTVVIQYPCGGDTGRVNEGNGMGTFDPNSAAFHMIIGKNQVIWTGEGGDAARIIWTDGRHLPDESNWAHPEPVSVGHWENGVLVVKTVGLPTSAGFGIPGKGVRGPSTVLTERFELVPGGKQMKIVYSYWDPKYYVKPDTYTYTFDRAFPHYALESYCDPGNPLNYTSVGPPPQNLK